MNHYQLWGMPASLWTGKARSYLRKKQIPFTEHAINQSKYMDEIVPAVGRFILPVLECPDGTFVERNPANRCQFTACPVLSTTEVTRTAQVLHSDQ